MRSLITGKDGFVGKHLQTLLINGNSIVDIGQVNIIDEKSLIQKLMLQSFDTVVHLAAQSFVPESFNNPQHTFNVNFYGTYNLLNALKIKGFSGKFLFVSSGDVYGNAEAKQLPIKETCLTKPSNPYAVSKIAAEALCYQWSQTEKIHITIARPFNHIGPGQREYFSISGFAKQIAEVKLGNCEPVLNVGDIDVTRDFTDVRDIVAAYKLLLLFGRNGEIYNICSGQEYSIKSLLEQLITLSGVNVKIKLDTARFRFTDHRRMQGCNRKICQETGWKPQISMEQTLKDLLLYWESQLI